ncbi:MAG: peptidyl-prolyl cis-trans isomerase, partial [Polyangiaceae bacterium]
MLRGPISAAVLLGLASLGVLGLGCNEKALQNDVGPDSGLHHSSASLTPEQAAKVLAKVGDKTITLGDYVATLEHMDQFDRLRYQSPERRKELLTEMINIELLAHEAVLKGYDKDPVAAQEERAILRDALLTDARKGATLPNDIPEAEVRAYFDAHKADYRDPERRRLSFIVLKDESTAPAVLEQAKKSATASQWGELVRAKSIDPQAKANVPVDLAGDVGMVSPPGDSRGDNVRVPEDVRVAAFEIPKVGDVLGRFVKAAGKVYIVRLTQKTDVHERAFAEADRQIRVKLAQDKITARETETLASLRTQFPVQIDDAALATVKVDLADAGHD